MYRRSKHFKRWDAAGWPLPEEILGMCRRGEGDCMVWDHYFKNGCPMVVRKKQPGLKQEVRSARRVILGLDTPSKVAVSTCGNPRCLNPDHSKVILATSMPKWQRDTGRAGVSGAQALKRAKSARDKSPMDWGKVRELRAAMPEDFGGKMRLYEHFAQKFGITVSAASRIYRHRRWRETPSMNPWAGLMR